MDDVVELYLCGDFNAWKVRGLPLDLEPDGTWVGRLVLDAGKSYRFRYHDNQGVWHTDYEADSVESNQFGTDNSVVDLTSVEKKPLTAKAAKKTAPRKSTPRVSKKTTGGRKPKAK